jgi:hypothetical protein
MSMLDDRTGFAFSPGMSDRLRPLIAVGRTELDAIAASAAGVPSARIIGAPDAAEILAANNDKRTLGIVRLVGEAEAEGRRLGWSTVAKIIDLGVVPDTVNLWVRPANEVAIYAGRLLPATGPGFRRARCHGVSHPRPGVSVLWLEDLTEARGAPFELDQLACMLRHLGEWNGANALNPPRLPFEPARDSVIQRWREWDYDGEFAAARATLHEPPLSEMYRGRAIDGAFALRDLLLKVNERALCHRHTLCFGDCNVGNLFHTPADTVAVDWAGLTSDPLGVDAGSVVGSSITWGRDFAEVARHERDLFEHYYEGLLSSGWRGERDDIRRGYLLHYGLYLLGTTILPLTLKRFDRVRTERRFDVPVEELPALAAGIVDLIPAYLDELPQLT